jgi:hypothetical protein
VLSYSHHPRPSASPCPALSSVPRHKAQGRQAAIRSSRRIPAARVRHGTPRTHCTNRRFESREAGWTDRSKLRRPSRTNRLYKTPSASVGRRESILTGSSSATLPVQLDPRFSCPLPLLSSPPPSFSSVLTLVCLQIRGSRSRREVRARVCAPIPGETLHPGARFVYGHARRDGFS